MDYWNYGQGAGPDRDAMNASKVVLTTCLGVALLLGLSAPGHALLIDYAAQAPTTTGQTATADFMFTDATHLQIILTETTPAAALDSSRNPAAAILTSIGFHLPGSTAITGGTVTVGPGSVSFGFRPGCAGGATSQCDAGETVSREWGATRNGTDQPIGNGLNYDFVSTGTAQVTPFAGDNRDGPAVLSGPQGGLLDDSAPTQRGGQGVIDNSVIILLSLNSSVSATDQAAFLTSLCCGRSASVVEWGSDDAFGTAVPESGTAVPEPGTLLLLGSGLVGLGIGGRRRWLNSAQN
jgi:hypothetical protein